MSGGPEADVVVVDLEEAEVDFVRLVDRAAAGEVIVITRVGTPVARLVPYRDPAARTPGAWKGRVRISPDFDDLPPGFG